jgi:hypothetical protein
VALGPSRLVLTIDAGSENPELELWAARRRAEVLARLLDRPVALRWRRGTVDLRPALETGRA